MGESFNAMMLADTLLLAPEMVLKYPVEVVGAKARMLACLAQFTGTPAPHVLAVGWHCRYRADPTGTVLNIRQLTSHLMSDCTYAVRSSAVIQTAGRYIAEDGDELTMAGWFESIMAVPVEHIPEAVISCYESVRSDRVAMLLQRTLQATCEDVQVAVAIQPYVESVRSAVLYTINPFHVDRRDEMLMSAAWGACHGLVSGSVTGDTCFIPRDGRQPTIQPGHKPWTWSARVGGGLIRRPTSDDRTSESVVTPTDLEALRRLGLTMENRLGGAQDIELVNPGDGWIPMQSRPLRFASPWR